MTPFVMDFVMVCAFSRTMTIAMTMTGEFAPSLRAEVNGLAHVHACARNQH